ncbi:hypothetical protein E2C01_002693 [Portunus trituberculatus]|uniref:Uncharacterized protein n=1 Tax=Portunus trituberculatus TaxID=210409 RepID=A0A5B7CNW9_PORTR|nr:hypothetical protein [Portunus trituberculatus]
MAEPGIELAEAKCQRHHCLGRILGTDWKNMTRYRYEIVTEGAQRRREGNSISRKIRSKADVLWLELHYGVIREFFILFSTVCTDWSFSPLTGNTTVVTATASATIRDFLPCMTTLEKDYTSDINHSFIKH